LLDSVKFPTPVLFHDLIICCTGLGRIPWRSDEQTPAETETIPAKAILPSFTGEGDHKVVEGAAPLPGFAGTPPASQGEICPGSRIFPRLKAGVRAG
jgi:hypothetical protein